MTTIVYTNGVMAADGLLTADSLIIQNNAKKLFENDLYMVGIAGDYADALIVKDWIIENNIEESLKPIFADIACYEVIVVEKSTKECWGYEGNDLKVVPLQEPVCIGSGVEIAFGALESMKMLGAPYSAAQAVHAAIQRDTLTGGRVQTISI